MQRHTREGCSRVCVWEPIETDRGRALPRLVVVECCPQGSAVEWAKYWRSTNRAQSDTTCITFCVFAPSSHTHARAAILRRNYTGNSVGLVHPGAESDGCEWQAGDCARRCHQLRQRLAQGEDLDCLCCVLNTSILDPPSINHNGMRTLLSARHTVVTGCLPHSAHSVTFHVHIITPRVCSRVLGILWSRPFELIVQFLEEPHSHPSPCNHTTNHTTLGHTAPTTHQP
jgi:hypothetical protein